MARQTLKVISRLLVTQNGKGMNTVVISLSASLARVTSVSKFSMINCHYVYAADLLIEAGQSR